VEKRATSATFVGQADTTRLYNVAVRFLILGQAYGCNDHVDHLDAQKRQEDSS
jgi:hypothetical protein